MGWFSYYWFGIANRGPDVIILNGRRDIPVLRKFSLFSSSAIPARLMNTFRVRLYPSDICFIYKRHGSEMGRLLSLWYYCSTSIGTEFRHNAHVNSSLLEQNGRLFADDILKCIFLNEHFCIPVKISLKFVPKGLIDNNPSLVQIMTRRQEIIWTNADLIHWCIYTGHWGKIS